MSPKDYLSFLRAQASAWIKDDAPSVAGFYGYVIEVHATEVTKIRIQRDGEDFADKPFYSTLGPYSPEIGDRVFCIRAFDGVIARALNKEE
jgi:hypothetical protein